MAVIDAIKKRYSCRKYQNKPIEKEKLREILEAARLAPSAKNLQDWRFVVVTDPKAKEQLAQAANDQMFLAEAGAIVVCCSIDDHVMRCGQPIGPIDVAIAMEHICLQATENGLASCWIGSFYPDKVRAALGIPEQVQIVELLGVGYPADEFKPHKRKPLEEIVSFEKWDFRGW